MSDKVWHKLNICIAKHQITRSNQVHGPLHWHEWGSVDLKESPFVMLINSINWLIDCKEQLTSRQPTKLTHGSHLGRGLVADICVWSVLALAVGLR